MAYNAGERKDIRQAEKAAALAERNRVAFVVAAMSTEAGRTWFYQTLADCRCFNDPFTGDALFEAHSKGERNMGLRIYNDIVNNCPDYFVLMMKEAAVRNQVDAERSTQQSSSEPDAGDTSDAEFDSVYATAPERSGGEDSAG